MDTLAIIMLVLSISLSAGRNILSKGMSESKFASAEFFLFQGVMFLVGATLLFPLALAENLLKTSCETFIYALIYGALLISAQWNYTVALKKKNTGASATVYSCGFILPTLSGVLFWGEELNVFNVIGIITVAFAVVSSGFGKSKGENKDSGGTLNLIIAMLSSGGLGIMQKIQQKSDFANEKGSFVFIAFLTVFLACSVLFLITVKTADSRAEFLSKTDTHKGKGQKILTSAGAGLCFGGANFLNTALAGAMDSALFFPLQNISSILMSLALGIIIFKEKIKKNDFITVSLGVVSVVLLVI